MSRDRAYILDITGLRDIDQAENADAAPQPAQTGRPWLAVHWKCCHVYSRIYRNRTGDAYEGRCPACGKLARARIGDGGVDQRFFTAY